MTRAVVGPSSLHALVIEGGWSTRRWSRQIADTLARALLANPPV